MKDQQDASDMLKDMPFNEQDLVRALRAPTEDAAHLDLDEMRACVAARRAQGETWTMPEHLAGCPICMEVYEILLAGVPPVSERAARRYVGLWWNKSARPAWRRARQFLTRAAAILLVVGLGALVADRATRQTSATLREGTLLAANGKRLAPGARLPGRTLIASSDKALVVLADGSELEITDHTCLSLFENPMGNETVNLQTGEVVFRVAKQARGKCFTVRTALGDVLVVGTQFRVTCRGENVTVFEHSGASRKSWTYQDLVSTVTIAVMEGRVLVKNSYEQVHIGAGQTAVLRSHYPVIEVTGTAGDPE